MPLEKNFGKTEDESEEENFFPDDLEQKHKWFDNPEEHYPDDREIDKNGKNREDAAIEFREKYRLVDESLINFNSQTGEWEINKMPPEKWSEMEDQLDDISGIPYYKGHR